MEETIYVSLDERRAELGFPQSNADVQKLIATGDVSQLSSLCVLLGETWEPRAEAENLLLLLAEHEDAWIRHMACMGLGYLARVHGKLDKRRVKPVLLRERRDNPHGIEDALDDIRLFLNWQIGKKRLRRQSDRAD